MKKNRNIVYLALVVIVLVVALFVARYCNRPAPASQAPATEAPPTEAPTATEPPTATQPPATEAPAATETPTQPASVPPEGPSVPTGDKPSLVFTNPVPGVDLQQVIAYALPSSLNDWTTPLKLAPFKDLQGKSFGPPAQYEGQTPVGLVEIGIDPTGVTQNPPPGLYLVTIDLASDSPLVSGRLTSLSGPKPPAVGTVTPTVQVTATGAPAGTVLTVDLSFQRTPQKLNPARSNSPIDPFNNLKPPPEIGATISADSVCFVVNTAAAKETAVYVRYCTQAGSPGQAALSVRQNFASQYASLQGLVNTAVDDLKARNLLEPDATIQSNGIVSEAEHAQHLIGCATAQAAGQTGADLQKECGSDITVAPVQESYFRQKLEAAKSQSSLPARFMLASLLASALQPPNRVSVPVAVVTVLEQIETPDGPILPGEYRLDYWYDTIDGQQVFYAATITGTTSGENPTQVTDQQIPAVPATFVNEDENAPDQPGAQISVCRIFSICVFFQSACY